MARDLEKALDSTLDDMINTKRGGGGGGGGKGKGKRDRVKGKGKGKKANAGAAGEKPKAVAKKAPKAKVAGEKAVKKTAVGAAQALDMSLEDIVKSHSSRKEKAPAAATSGKDSKAKKLGKFGRGAAKNRRESDESKGKGKGKGKKQKKTKGKGKGKDAWGGASWSDPWSSYDKGKGKGRDASWGGKGKGKNSWGGKGGGKKGDSWSSKGSGKHDYWEPAPKKDWGSKWEARGKGGGKDWGGGGKGGGKDSWDSAPAFRSNKRARTEVSWDSEPPAWSAKSAGKGNGQDSWQKKEAERWGQKERGPDSWGAKEREPRGNDWQDSERSDRRKAPAREDRESWGTGQRGQKRAYEEETRRETREGPSGQSKRIKVTNIPRDLDMYDIKDAFEAEAGKIVDCKMARGTAMITFGNAKDARKAVDTFDRGELNGKTIEVTFVQ